MAAIKWLEMCGSGRHRNSLAIPDSNLAFLSTMTSGLRIKRCYVGGHLELRNAPFEAAIGTSSGWTSDGYSQDLGALKTLNPWRLAHLEWSAILSIGVASLAPQAGSSRTRVHRTLSFCCTSCISGLLDFCTLCNNCTRLKVHYMTRIFGTFCNHIFLPFLLVWFRPDFLMARVASFSLLVVTCINRKRKLFVSDSCSAVCL